MGRCIVVQTKYGPQRVQVADGVKSLPQSDIEALEQMIGYVRHKMAKKKGHPASSGSPSKTVPDPPA